MKTVVVGMSGGVDSSYSAFLLKEAGYKVIGLFMKNWEETNASGVCHATQDYEDAQAVAHQLGIPFYTVNFAKEYWEHVFSQCLKEYELGYTPNPDILCNREIKFKAFFNKALEFGADFVATGHYCRRIMNEGEWALGRGLDPEKDQSYFLYTLKSSILEKVLFPIGELTKKEVRRLSTKIQLPTAAKKDSTGICFIGKRNFPEFLSKYVHGTPGNFETPEGEVIGKHRGIPYYTIGQRRGLGIGGPGDAWYVIGKNRERNAIIIVQGEEHPSLYQRSLIANEITWVQKSPTFPCKCTAKIRYRSADAPCEIYVTDNQSFEVIFEKPQKAITVGQSIVFYDNQICLGGGVIKN